MSVPSLQRFGVSSRPDPDEPEERLSDLQWTEHVLHHYYRQFDAHQRKAYRKIQQGSFFVLGAATALLGQTQISQQSVLWGHLPAVMTGVLALRHLMLAEWFLKMARPHVINLFVASSGNDPDSSNNTQCEELKAIAKQLQASRSIRNAAVQSVFNPEERGDRMANVTKAVRWHLKTIKYSQALTKQWEKIQQQLYELDKQRQQLERLYEKE